MSFFIYRSNFPLFWTYLRWHERRKRSFHQMFVKMILCIHKSLKSCTYILNQVQKQKRDFTCEELIQGPFQSILSKGAATLAPVVKYASNRLNDFLCFLLFKIIVVEYVLLYRYLHLQQRNSFPRASIFFWP